MAERLVVKVGFDALDDLRIRIGVFLMGHLHRYQRGHLHRYQRGHFHCDHRGHLHCDQREHSTLETVALQLVFFLNCPLGSGDLG